MSTNPQKSVSKMPYRGRLYVQLVQFPGLIVLGYSVYQATHAADLRWLWLLVLTAAASFLSVRLSKSDPSAGSVAATAGDFFIFAALMVAGPAAGALMGAAEGLAGSWRVRVRSVHKVVFNVGQLVLAAYLTGLLLEALLPGGSVQALSTQSGTPVILLKILFCAVGYFFLNSLMVTTAMIVVSGRPLSELVGKSLAWGLVSNCLNACLVTIVLAMMGPISVGLAISILPLILVAYALKRANFFLAAGTADHPPSEPEPGLFSWGLFNDVVPRKAQAYLLAVVFIGLPLWVYCLRTALGFGQLDWLYLAALTVVASCFPIRLFSVRQGIWLTLSDIFVFVAVFHFGAEVAAVIASLEALVFNLRSRTKGVHRWFFNVAQIILVAFLVGRVFSFLDQITIMAGPSRIGVGRIMVALLTPMVCGFVYYALSLGMTVVAVAWSTHQPAVTLWRNNLGWCYPSVLGALVGAISYLVMSGFPAAN